jgi:hypothetical protein
MLGKRRAYAEKSKASILALTFFFSAADKFVTVFFTKYFTGPSKIVFRTSTGVRLHSLKEGN